MASRPRPSGTVTFLFTDIEGSTRLWDAYPAAMAAALERHDAILRGLFGTSNAFVFSTGGDGFGAAFDRSDDAVAVAVAVQRAVLSEPWPADAVLRVRMGLHTGEAQERDGDYFGAALNRAARIMALASGGQVLCSEATASVVRDGLPSDVHLSPLGTVQLKGFGDTEPVFGVEANGLLSGFHAIDAEPRPGKLPRSLSRLVGRSSDVDEISALLGESSFVTLTGTGGVGKTRLSLAVAQSVGDKFADGVWFIALAPVNVEIDVIQAVASVLEVRASAGGPLLDLVCDAIADRRMLVVLDNCEHVTGAVRSIVSAIGARCPNVAVMATSRERLGVAGERVVVIRPLPTEGIGAPAIELFLDRVDRPDVASDPSEMDAVRAICRQLDGLPLALELAAARCRAMLPSAVEARLRDRFRLLSDTHRVEARQQTLRATVQWSFDLLENNEKRVLARLSVFAGGFGLDAAENICSDEELDAFDIDDALAALVDKSLVDSDRHRYSLLETTRQFAHQILDDSGDADRVADRHATWFVDFVQAARLGLRGPDELLWLHRLRDDWANVRAAFRSALERDDLTNAIIIVTHLTCEAFFRQPEAITWSDSVLARLGSRDHPNRHELLGAAGWTAWGNGDAERTRMLGELAMTADPKPGTALDLLPEYACMAGYAWNGQGEQSLAVCRAVLDRFDREPTDPWTEMWWVSFFLIAGLGLLDPTEIGATAARIGIAAERSQCPTALAWARFTRATNAAARGEPNRVLFEEAHALAESVDNVWIEAQITIFAVSRLATTASPESLRALARSARELHRAGWRMHTSQSLINAIPLLADIGEVERAATLYGGMVHSVAARFTPHIPLLANAKHSLTATLGEDRFVLRSSEGQKLSTPGLIDLLDM